MRIYKTERVPAKEIERLEKVVCDLCGREGKGDWRSSSYDATEVEIRMKTGESYPEMGSGTEEIVDMCPDCWRDKFVPWLATFGGKPTVKEWEF